MRTLRVPLLQVRVRVRCFVITGRARVRVINRFFDKLVLWESNLGASDSG